MDLDLDALFARLEAECREHEAHLAWIAVDPSAPAHWALNVRNGWFRSVEQLAQGAITAALGRGGAKKRSGLVDHVTKDPRWAAITQRLVDGGALVPAGEADDREP